MPLKPVYANRKDTEAPFETITDSHSLLKTPGSLPRTSSAQNISKIISSDGSFDNDLEKRV